MELESLQGDTIYFNEWFEEMCVKILNRPDVTFNDFLNNMRPENQKWWRHVFDIEFIQYNIENITKDIITHYIRIGPKNEKTLETFYILPKRWLQYAFDFEDSILGLNDSNLYYLDSKWKKVIRNYKDTHKIYFSSKLIKNYTIYSPNKKIKLKRRQL